MLRLILCGLVLCCLGALTACARTPSVAALRDARLVEASGLAATLAGPRGYWALNDGGNRAALFRLSEDGATLARLPVVGARNRDWEDLASFRWRDSNWLLIADTGDNRARRQRVALHLVAEPAPEARRARVTATVSVRYPDGPRDAEAVAVDPLRGEILVLSKRDRPGRLYRLPLSAFDTPTAVHRLEHVGVVAPDGPPSALALLRQPELLAVGSHVTALDISADGRHAVVLGYRRARTVTRRDGETWLTALSRLDALPDHRLAQAEAVAFSRDATHIVITSEGAHAPLLRQDWPTPTP
ncbi:MAG: hypothetical protein AAGA11_00210 [Pseudomonadota bacterium]